MSVNIFYQEQLFKRVQDKYLFIDNDFLGEAFNSEDTTDFLLDLSDHSHLTIDPLTEFEFLRDVFLKEQIDLRLQFLKESTINVALNHPDVYKKVSENALVLSKIYAHQGRSKGVSTIDLMLASRVMLYAEKSLLLTGNLKDFPPFLFNVVEIINIQQSDGRIKAYGILVFNIDSFAQCYESIPH